MNKVMHIGAMMTMGWMLFSGAGAVAAEAPVNKDATTHVALEGYDPVAFFEEKQATKGNPSITATHAGAKYYFASEAHKALFEKDPDSYLPAFGGYCAYGVSKGGLFPVDIGTWEIVEGRLILQFNQDVREQFKKDLKGGLAQADAEWIKLSKQQTGE